MTAAAAADVVAGAKLRNTFQVAARVMSMAPLSHDRMGRHE
ncbi:hypothetical protein [Acidiphilium sp. 20-67-58]|nr:hypothetical protein [Acidiphilium sp. 20-67-58]